MEHNVKKALQPKKWIPRGPYSLATQLGNMVFLSGQIAQDNEGKAIGADVKAQTGVVIDKIEAWAWTTSCRPRCTCRTSRTTPR